MTAYRHDLSITQIRNMQKEQTSKGKFRLIRLDVGKSDDHEDPLTSLFVDAFTGRLITSDKEGLVKIWTKDK